MRHLNVKNESNAVTMVKAPDVRVVFDRRKVASESVPSTVEIMVYEHRTRRRRYVSTGVRVCADEWDERYGVVRRKDMAQLNRTIKEQVKRCLDAVAGGSADGAAVVRAERNDDSFLVWMRDAIERSELDDSTKRQHLVMMRNLEEYGKIRRWEHVNDDSVQAWLDSIKDRGVDQVTVYGYWKRLRKWVNVAIRKRLLSADCLVGLDVSRGKHKERAFLTDEEIRTLRELELPNAHLRDARDRFIAQMGCGLAYADFVEFDFTRHQNVGGYETLQGVRKKTGEQFFVVMLPMAVGVLERWEWKVPKISNAKYNDYLSTIMGIAGIDKKVTSHVARHSYACYCLRHGVRIEAVQRALGHSDIKTTQIYAKLMDMDVVDAFTKMK